MNLGGAFENQDVVVEAKSEVADSFKDAIAVEVQDVVVEVKSAGADGENDGFAVRDKSEGV